MQTEVITEPVFLPIELDETKEYLEVSNEDDNNLISSLMEAAVVIAEDHCQRVWVDRTFRQTFDRPGILGAYEDYVQGFRAYDSYSRHGGFTPQVENHLKLFKKPVKSITSIEYFTKEQPDTAQVWDPSKYNLDNRGTIARVYPNADEYFPLNLRDSDSIVVTYVAGSALVKNDVPESVRLAMKAIVANLYENRGDMGNGGIPAMAERLLGPHQNITGF